MSVLPSPLQVFFEKLLFNYFCSNIPDQIKRCMLYSSHEDSGIAMSNTPIQNNSLKCHGYSVFLMSQRLNRQSYHYYAMVVCRSYDTAGSLAHGVFISRPTGNPDPLAKSRPTDKVQIHW